MSEGNESRSRWVTLTLAISAGFITLAFQIVCTRILLQHFGAGTTAIASMVATSLMGLAVGSVYFGRAADRTHRPLNYLAIIFILLATATMLLSQLHGPVSDTLDNLFGKSVTNLSAHQILFCLLTTLPINFLLGGILPILVEITSGKSPTTFAPIYASETMGAMFGAILSGIYMIPIIGVTRSLFAIAGLCIATAFVCFAGRNKRWNSQEPEITSLPNKTTTVNRPSLLFLVLVISASCASLGMEIIWQRYFVILFGSDTHSLAIVTASFLFGISIGAWLSTRLMVQFENTQQLYSVSLTTIGFAVLISTWLLINLVDGKLSLWIVGSNTLDTHPLFSRLVIACITMLFPSVALGIALPTAAAFWIGTEEDDSNGSRDSPSSQTGKRTGEIYGAAIFGNVIGVIVVGFLLIQLLGLAKTAFTLSALCIGCGITSQFLNFRSPTSKTSITYGTSSILRIAIVTTIIGWGYFGYLIFNHSMFLGIHSAQNIEVEFYSEGSENSVAVISSVKDANARRMLIDGVAIGESGGGVDEKQQLLAHLPFLLRPKSTNQHVLTIGLGTGILAGELVECNEVAKTTCVELSSAVIEAASHFSDLNGNVLANEKLDLVQADGIRFLRVTDRKFDVIVSDAKSRPGHAGNVAFFTSDYYRCCESKLSEDGIFVQWIGLNTSTQALEVILKSFCGSFQFGHVAIATPNSIYFVGTKQPLNLDNAHVTESFRNPSTDSLSTYHWNSFDDLVSMYWLDQHTISRSFVADARGNSFDRPTLESFSLSNVSGEHIVAAETKQLTLLGNLILFDMAGDIEDSHLNGRNLRQLPQPLQSKIVSGRQATQFLINAAVQTAELGDDWLDNAADAYKEAVRLLPDLTRQQTIAGLYRQLANKAKAANQVDKEFSALDAISDLGATSAADEFRLAEILTRLNQPEKALDYLYKAASKAPDQPRYRNEFGFQLFALGRFNQAQAQFDRVVRRFPDNVAAKFGTAICIFKTNPANDEAIAQVRSAIAKRPELEDRLNQLGLDPDQFGN